MVDMKTEKAKSLPHDVVIQILLKLPAHHLWPLRRVSKTWLHLLTKDLQFAHLHFHQSTKLHTTIPSTIASRQDEENTSFCLATEYTACDKATERKLPWLDGKASIMGICNGMFCLLRLRDGYNVYIWNPLTGDHINIPYAPTQSRYPDGYTGAPGLALGFGFHEVANQYKLIKVFVESDYSKNDHHTQVSVYTLGVDTAWRIIQEDMPYSLDVVRKTKPVVNAAFHWLAGGQMRLSARIVALDLKNESFREFLPPKVVDLDLEKLFASNVIGELGGLLGYFCALYQRNVQIWVMSEYGEVDSWTKLFVVGNPEVSGAFTFLIPLYRLNSREIIMRKNCRELIVYNHETNSVKNLKRFCFDFYKAYVYMGSIISPTHIGSGAHIHT